MYRYTYCFSNCAMKTGEQILAIAHSINCKTCYCSNCAMKIGEQILAIAHSINCK